MPRLIVQGPAQVGRQGFVSGSTLGGGVGVATKQLGREISTLGRVLQASSEQAARRKAAEFGIALQDAAVDINLDPNIENREKRFQETQQSLRDKFRPNAFLGSPASFDTNADISSGRLGVMVKSRAMQDAISRGVADNDFILDELANDAAQTDNPDDLAVAMIRGEISIGETVETGLRSQADADRRLKKFRQDVNAGRLSRLQNDNPVAGLKFVQSEQFAGDEAERQVWRARMVSSMRAQLRAENAEESAQKKAQDDLQKSREEASVKTLTALTDSRPVTSDDVMALEPDLSATDFKTWMGIAANGGTLGEPDHSNKDLYFDLRQRALRGEDVSSDLRAAFLGGFITQTDHNSIEKISTDKRFKEPRRSISIALDAGFVGDPGKQNKEVQATQFFDQWVEANPGASLEEAQAKAEQLTDQAFGRRDPEKREAANLRPRFAVENDDGRTVNVRATAQATKDAFEAGELSVLDFEQEAKMLERIIQAQDFKAERQKAREAAQ